MAGQTGRKRGAIGQIIRDLLIGVGGLAVCDNCPVVGFFQPDRRFPVRFPGLALRLPCVGNA